MSNKRRTRILIAKAGLDGHDRGAKIITRALRDAGFEVVYTGLHQTPEMIAESALQEDVDAIGVSLLSGAHNFLFPEIIKDLKAKGGGVIPDEDIESLKSCGVKKIFGPGTSTTEMIEWINSNVRLK